LPEEVIARIQSPVGLDLGAVKPEEIALSILAGLVAIRRQGSGGWKQKPGT
jgi:xanthine dehydrogenase accessory factor